MAHMRCECGKRLSNTCFPNTMEGSIRGMYEYKDRTVWLCEECGRLFIDVDDPDLPGCYLHKIYVPENGKPEVLFDIGTDKQFLSYLKEQWMRNKEIFQQIEANEYGGSIDYWQERAARFEIELNKTFDKNDS